MDGITPAQLKVIQTWTEQRDSLLREIGILNAEKEELKKSKTEDGLALADLHTSISEARGRLAELVALEDRHKDSVSIEVAELEARKSRLQAECEAQVNATDASKAEQDMIIETIVVLKVANDVMKDQSAIVDSVVGQIIQTSQLHVSDMKTTVAEIKAVTDEVIAKATENITQTNIVLEKLPRYIFELQKPIPVRRAYATEPGTVIEPEEVTTP